MLYLFPEGIKKFITVQRCDTRPLFKIHSWQSFTQFFLLLKLNLFGHMHNQKQIRLVLVAYNLSPIFGSIMDFEIWRRTKKTVAYKITQMAYFNLSLPKYIGNFVLWKNLVLSAYKNALSFYQSLKNIVYLCIHYEKVPLLKCSVIKIMQIYWYGRRKND